MWAGVSERCSSCALGKEDLGKYLWDGKREVVGCWWWRALGEQGACVREGAGLLTELPPAQVQS